MPTIKYISHDGKETQVDVENGLSVMEGAVRNDVEGILGDCSGGCTCATCHVYVDESWGAKLPPPCSIELSMLEFAAAPKLETSRLSCQLIVTDELDGMVVHIPETQH